MQGHLASIGKVGTRISVKWISAVHRCCVKGGASVGGFGQGIQHALLVDPRSSDVAWRAFVRKAISYEVGYMTAGK